ncbi:hypothetical protein N836_30185 [Leptolyngbya sp. Heron Island J]|uniref:CU044_2847 family protein n=1 Tax=Leptolyngbya sp. Heron Island J TaxID=1385935 RepID=UPI0003B9886F|nr:CU044_2847 family protein [Leptolyngbya sp. Heron Island J]ESA38798.1 hypothetical protein N836_30185 [Leptolyngbya sp. Heron Island J]
MSHFLSVKTPGGPIWVEVPDGEDTDSVELVANRRDIPHTFEASAQALKKNAQYLINLMSSLGPQEVEVTFGMSVGVEASTPVFALAQVNGEASYTVTLKWQSGNQPEGKNKKSSQAECDINQN